MQVVAVQRRPIQPVQVAVVQWRPIQPVQVVAVQRRPIQLMPPALMNTLHLQAI